MNLIDSKTYNNLARAYAGETQAYVRYKFIEYGARMQGYNAMAELIDKVIYNEFNHARMFYTFIQKASNKEIKNIEICSGYPFKEKWDLQDNLRLGAEDEKNEVEIYGQFASIARQEGFEEIARLFEMTAEVEVKHQKLFAELYNQMKSGTLYKKAKPVVWRCADCGYETTSKEAWKKCPLCQAEQGRILLHVNQQL